MRDVYIEGKRYQIPDDAKFIAMDENGSCYSFERRPSRHNFSWWLDKDDYGQANYCGYFFGRVTDPSRYDWRKTLTEVPRA